MEIVPLSRKIEHQDPPSITLDDVMRQLNHEYWVSYEQIDPVGHFEDLVEELDEEHFMAVARLVYDAILHLPGTKNDGSSFVDLMHDEDTGELLSLDECKEMFMEWYENDYGDIGDYYEDETEWGNGTIRHLYNLWLTRKLDAAGKTRAQVTSALEVVEQEGWRRQSFYGFGMDYASHRNSGGSHAEFISDVLPHRLRAGVLLILKSRFADGEIVKHPDDMTEQEIDAEVEQYITESIEDYTILDTSYNYHQKGVLPAFYTCTGHCRADRASSND